VTNHQVCKRCENVLSRDHAIDCLNLRESIMNIYPGFRLTGLNTASLLDHLLTLCYDVEEVQVYENIAKLIQRIYVECLGYTQMDNGYWERPATDEDDVASRSGEPGVMTNRQNSRMRDLMDNPVSRPCKRRRVTSRYSTASTAPRFASYWPIEPVMQSSPSTEESPSIITQTASSPDVSSIEGRVQLPPFRTLVPISPRLRTLPRNRLPSRNGSQPRLMSPSELLNLAYIRRAQNEHTERWERAQRDRRNNNWSWSYLSLSDSIWAYRPP